MSKNTVLQLRSSIGYFGAENVVVELAKSLSKTDYHSIVGVMNNTYNPHIEMADVAKKNKLETKIFDCDSPFSLKTILEMRKFIKQRKIDIIQSHGYKTNFYAIFAALFERKPLICTCHPWTETSYNLKAKIYSWLDKHLLTRFDKLVAVSSNVRDEIIAQGISKDKITLIENGIDIHRFSNSFNKEELCRKYKIDPGRRIIGTIGRLVKEKAQDLFLEAAKLIIENFPEAYFLIVGDGPLRDYLLGKVEALNLHENVRFTGVCDDIPEILALMDIFVLSSISEGLPMVLLEAMAARKPIVTTKVGEVPKIITDNQDGIIVSPNNVTELKTAIEFLLMNKNKANLFAQKVYHKVIQHFSSEVMAERYIKIYEQLLSSN